MKKWTPKEDSFLENNVGSLTYKQMADNLKRTRMSVMKHCQWRGLSNSILSEKTRFKKIYKVNDNFFSNYNILSCYYAGLIASDGSIHKKSNAISITQAKSRLSCLEKFKKDAGYNGVIYGPTKTIGQDAYALVISSKKWKKDLKNNFMITPNKSLTLLPPDLTDKKMIISFINGLIDGDGSVGAYNYKNKKDIVPIITFCGTKSIVEWVANNLNKYFIIKNRTIRYRQIISNNTYFLSFSGCRVIKFYQYLVKNDIPFMRCKWSRMVDKLFVKGLDYYLKNKRKTNKRDNNGRFCKIS